MEAEVSGSREIYPLPETVGQCLDAWMRETGVSAGRLADQLGYKSKTSVLRVLQDRCADESRKAFAETLRPRLSPEWRIRLDRALAANRIGPVRFAMYEVIRNRMLSGSSPEEMVREDAVSADLAAGVKAKGGTLLILGCPGRCAFSLAATLAALNPAVTVTHYMTREELAASPVQMDGLLSRLGHPAYDAALLAAAPRPTPPDIPWNLAVYLSPEGSGSRFLYPDGSGNCAEGVANPEQLASLAARIRQMPGTKLFHGEELRRGNEYILFLREAYQLEAGRGLAAMKPTPGIQMIPAGEVEASFSDFLSDHFDPVVAARETLISLHKRRIENFYHRRKRTLLLLNRGEMIRFAREGVLSDQFYFCRPYTPAERVRILQALARFGGEKQNEIRFLPDSSWRVSFEAYEGRGVLLYSSYTRYYTGSENYRELFLPGQEFAELFAGLAENCADGAPEATDASWDALIRIAEDGR